MFRQGDLPELLAPAGSYDAMLAAVESGADAVYMGGRGFGARAFAENFDEPAMEDAVRYCHLHGVRVYVTVNVLIYDKEMDDAVAYCRRLYHMGVDAVIVADTGLSAKLQRELPHLPQHASTQMSVHNTEGVRVAHALGMQRAVLARELSLGNIRRAVNESPLPIEVFVHGALCVCYSGQCLFSSLVGGRSGNRGACAQPCRLPYNAKTGYPLSLKDLCLARHIPALIDSGVASLKIEGRMKSAAYVRGVTSIYRRLLDQRRGCTDEEERRLSDLFSRDGFTDAYLRGEPMSPMTGIRGEQDKERTRHLSDTPALPRRVAVSAEAIFVGGRPCTLSLYNENKRITVTGAVPYAAQNQPLTAQELTTRLCKMGNTYISLAPEDVKITVEGGLFLPPSAVNALRRSAAEAFMDTRRLAGEEEQSMPPTGAPAREAHPAVPPYAPRLRRTAQLFDAALAKALPARIKEAFDVLFAPLMSYDKADGVCGVALPPVVTDGEYDAVCTALVRAKTLGATHALVGNLSMLGATQAAGLTAVGDFRLNICNKETAAYVRSLGIEDYILSPELTLPMARDIGGGVISCGRVPLMLTERCFIREIADCSRCQTTSLTDRRGKRFALRSAYGHRNLIFNSAMTYMGDKQDALHNAGIRHEHMLFTTESASAAVRLFDTYMTAAAYEGDIRRI